MDSNPNVNLPASVELIPSILGSVSIGVWMVALAPQLYLNYKRKNVEAVSTLFVATWLLGDLFSLVGSIILQHRLTIVGQAFLFILNDMVLVGQLIYYSNYYTSVRCSDVALEGGAMKAQRLDKGDGWDTCLEKQGRTLENPCKGSRDDTQEDPVGSDNRPSTSNGAQSKSVFAAVLLVNVGTLAVLGLTSSPSSPASPAGARSLLEVAEALVPELGSPGPSSCHAYVGSIVSWISGLLYFFSRIPQVYYNYQRKSCDGLAIGLFLTAIIANTTFGSQFIVEQFINSFLKNQPMELGKFAAFELPFIVGSIGTLIYDFIIVYQFTAYADPVEVKNTSSAKSVV